MLQILEDGRLTDGQGRTVHFAHSVIIMTSNSKNLEAQFKPEFLNRIDDIVTFNSLEKEHIEAIVDIQLKRLQQLLAEKKLTLEVSKETKKFLADKGWDPTYGARPLRRAIQKYIQDPLAGELLAGRFQEGSQVKTSLKGEQIVFQ